MPTYEYKCDACGYIFEKFQGMKDKPIAKCPTCGGKVQRLIGTGAGVIFKVQAFMQWTWPCLTALTTLIAMLQPVVETKPCCGRDTPCDKRPCES
jgi:putative FmdB family regulatory protein